MRRGETYEDFFIRKNVRCCGKLPIPLPHIPVNNIQRGGVREHSSHYFNYAFECQKCGAIYEVIIEDYSYTSIGDFMQPNYTSRSIRPSLEYLVNHPTLKQELGSAREEWLKQSGILDKSIWELQDKIDRKVGKLEKITGSLDKEQTYEAEKNLGKVELATIKEYKDKQADLLKTRITRIRELVGLPMLGKPNRIVETEKQIQLFKLRSELSRKQTQLSSLNTNLATIEEQNKLLMEIDEIESELELLGQ